MAELFHTLVYLPIYNALAFFVDVIPGSDLGVAIIIVIVLVRSALFPISWAAIKTQMTMRALEPKMKELRETLKENKEELAKRTMALFKEHKVNPFASFLLLLIQLPVVIGLYLVFQSESRTFTFDPALLYSFIQPPLEVSVSFLGLIDLSGKSFFLAGAVIVTQFIFAKLMTPPIPPKKDNAEPSFQEDLQRSMHLQMRYVLPLVLGVVAYVTSASIALYFFISNLFSICQELLVRHMNAKKHD